jgi:hypothetical protein
LPATAITRGLQFFGDGISFFVAAR